MAAKVGIHRSRRWTILFISTLSGFFAQLLSLCSAQTPTSSIKAGQVLRYSDKLLVSADGGFQLGFFNASDKMKGFLGIRYTNKLETHMVWVANRDAPFNGTNATLAMDADGLLKIVSSGSGVITVNPDGKAPNSTATLENSGNLVVRSEMNEVVWESFDHQTGTLLPGMKLGSNHVSGKKRVLRSWLSPDNPGTGAFTLEYNNSGGKSRDEFVVRRRGSLFSTYGQDIFEEVVDSKRSYISDETEAYFNLSATAGVVDLYLRIVNDGRVSVSTKNGSSTYVEFCNGGVDYPFECAGTNMPACRSGEDAFVRRGLIAYNTSASMQYSDTNSSIAFSDCLDRCIRDCSCVAFSTLYSDETGCKFWRDGAQFELTEFSLMADIYVKNSSYPISGASSELFGSDRIGNKWWTLLVISATALISVVLI